MACKEKGTGILPSTSDGNFSRGYPGVSRAIAYDEDAISRLSGHFVPKVSKQTW